MQKFILNAAVIFMVGNSSVFADTLPVQYSYQVALFAGGEEIYKHSNFTHERNQFGTKKNIPYLVKACVSTGTKTTNKNSVKQFSEGVAYYIDMQTSKLSVFETVIDESTYRKPEKSEVDTCMNTGEPTEREYRYDVDFDVTSLDTQHFTFKNDREVYVTVRKQE